MDGIGIEDRRDGMAKALYLEAFDSFIFTMFLEALGTAHPDNTALYLRRHQAPSIAMATYIYVGSYTRAVKPCLTNLTMQRMELR